MRHIKNIIFLPRSLLNYNLIARLFDVIRMHMENIFHSGTLCKVKTFAIGFKIDS